MGAPERGLFRLGNITLTEEPTSRESVLAPTVASICM